MNEVASIGYDLSSLSFNNTIRPNSNNSYSNTVPSSSASSSPSSLVPSQSQPSLSIAQPSPSSSSIPQPLSNHEIDINRIAHLILVDQKLNNSNTINADTSGVDIILSTVSQSILADSYALKMNTNANNDTTTNNNITTDKK